MTASATLVTGGTGFLGCYVARDLLASGHRVSLLDIRPDLPALAQIAGLDAAARCRILPCDVTMQAQLFAAVRAALPDAIVHLASPLPPDTERDAGASLQQMTHAHLSVLEAARLFGVRKVVWASAPSVFGPPSFHGGPDALVGDDAPHHPTTLYGICKSANERLSAWFGNRHGVESVGLRFCQGYGPGKRRGRPFGYEVFEHALARLPYTLPAGDDVINWQYVEEMSDIVLRALDAPPGPARTLNTTGEVVSTKDTLALLRRLCPGVAFSAAPGVSGLVNRYDVDRLERETGFRSRVTAEEGFRRTLATMAAWRAAGRPWISPAPAGQASPIDAKPEMNRASSLSDSGFHLIGRGVPTSSPKAVIR
jgi:UDP-glucose 4-epimerase